MEQIEEKRPDCLKEGEDVWRKKLYDWKKVYQFGAEEHLTTDGEVLNQIRRELLQVCENYFSGTTAYDGYKKKIPHTVKEGYMARETEILEIAQRLVKKYTQSHKFRYILVKRPRLRRADRRKLQVDLLVGRIRKLEICVKRKDLLGMRIFSKEDELDKMLIEVYQKIKELPKASTSVESDENKKRSSWKNQMTLEEFIC